MNQIDKDALNCIGDNQCACPDHIPGTDQPATERRAIPMRNGLLLNRAFVEQFPHERRLQMWETEYYAARCVMARKGKKATLEEYDRMASAAMMWKREKDYGAEIPALQEDDSL